MMSVVQARGSPGVPSLAQAVCARPLAWQPPAPRGLCWACPNSRLRPVIPAFSVLGTHRATSRGVGPLLTYTKAGVRTCVPSLHTAEGQGRRAPVGVWGGGSGAQERPRQRPPRLDPCCTGGQRPEPSPVPHP